eukprot:CAMPEP_0174323280 /NCGR_PEP_ID=MMETSP0810-20121108/11679_1 /TAXON_ID=73025 ORGANISM="Eutreptiella gymnastica-like, Strain CCMP1594" /NCGR_SAMPLE_ID=MMETSP0810 /ASSEMBLY_ACC=CAM_ASM_000659 /LENGTH=197 /DNA_ID=CAMNT_0015435609 /DNA_START=402 /DNA_END=992 /DNA_ORIENTATION=+
MTNISPPLGGRGIATACSEGGGPRLKKGVRLIYTARQYGVRSFLPLPPRERKKERKVGSGPLPIIPLLQQLVQQGQQAGNEHPGSRHMHLQPQHPKHRQEHRQERVHRLCLPKQDHPHPEQETEGRGDDAVVDGVQDDRAVENGQEESLAGDHRGDHPVIRSFAQSSLWCTQKGPTNGGEPALGRGSDGSKSPMPQW